MFFSSSSSSSFSFLSLSPFSATSWPLACESIRFSFARRRWGRFARRKLRTRFNVKPQSYRSFKQEKQAETATITSVKPTIISALTTLLDPQRPERTAFSTIQTPLNPTEKNTYFTMKSSSNPSFLEEATTTSKRLTDTSTHRLTYSSLESTQASFTARTSSATSLNPTDISTHFKLKSQNNPSFPC